MSFGDAKCNVCDKKIGETVELLYACGHCLPALKGRIRELEMLVAYQKVRIENQAQDIKNRIQSNKRIKKETCPKCKREEGLGGFCGTDCRWYKI